MFKNVSGLNATCFNIAFFNNNIYNNILIIGCVGRHLQPSLYQRIGQSYCSTLTGAICSVFSRTPVKSWNDLQSMFHVTNRGDPSVVNLIL